MEYLSGYSMYKIVESYLKSTETQKKIILEPLCCLLKLSLIHHKPMGTKISVTDNSILYHEPTLFQGAFRTYTGDSRDDLHNLCYPIMICLQWFPKETYSLFYEHCIQGLAYLKNNYDPNSIVNHTLSHYITLITDNIKEEKLPESPIIEHLRDFWKEDEIEIVQKIYEYMVTLNDTDNQTYLKIIETLLEEKEKKIYSYIQKVSTSYE
jgi:hypothetical protein